MKKLTSLLLVLCLVFALAACGKGDNDGDETNVPTEPAVTEAPAFNHEGLVTDLYSEKGELTDEYGDIYEYNLSVPALNGDTKAVEAVNNTIREKYEPLYKELQTALSEKNHVFLSNIYYECYWNGSLLSLVIRNQGYVEEENSYDIYNFDFAEDKLYSKDDLLGRMNISEKDFVKAVRREAVLTFDGVYAENDSSVIYGGDYPYLRAKTISADNINTSLDIYCDNNGALNAIVPIYTPAGSGIFKKPAKLSFGLDNTSLEAGNSFVKAKLSKGKLTVRFDKTEEAEQYLSAYNFECGKDYEISGVYNKYTAMYVGVCGQDFFPYIFLVTEKGSLECVFVFECLQAGFLCSAGPVAGVNHVKSFSEGEVDLGEGGGYHTTYATDEYGNEYDLSENIYAMKKYLPVQFALRTFLSDKVAHETAAETTYYSEYFIQFNDDGTLTIDDNTVDVGIITSNEAVCNFIGMNENGLLYSVGYYNESLEEYINACLSLADIDYSDIRVTVIAGDDLFDTHNKPLVFKRTYG